MFKKIVLGLIAILGLALTFGSAGAFESTANFGGDSSEGGTVTLSYVEWDTEVASTHVIAEVLKDEGFNVNVIPLDNAVMWQAVANGEADGMVGAWLPLTHGEQFDEYGDQMEDLGKNLEGAITGLVVPTYMEDVNSIEDLTDEAGKKITGIEPGAGVMNATEKALEEYPNLSDWSLESSSSGAMATALGQAIDNKDEIVVTGWSPHWKFQKYDLKYLDDPKGIFGDGEEIHTMVREGLKEDNPRAYQILDQFEWDLEDMESVMVDIHDVKDPQQAARDWVDNNQDKVEAWVAE